jgi:hypothetical protein
MSLNLPQTLMSTKKKSRKETLRLILSAAIILVGILHFAIPAPFTKIVPSSLPHPLLLVYISGFFEIVGAQGQPSCGLGTDFAVYRRISSQH